MTPSKADSQYERLCHAFGRERIQRELNHLVSTWGQRDPLQQLTDDARDELVYRLISDHKLVRKMNAANRKLYAERQRHVR